MSGEHNRYLGDADVTPCRGDVTVPPGLVRAIGSASAIDVPRYAAPIREPRTMRRSPAAVCALTGAVNKSVTSETTDARVAGCCHRPGAVSVPVAAAETAPDGGRLLSLAPPHAVPARKMI